MYMKETLMIIWRGSQPKFSPDMKAKELLYQAMRRKRLDVPPPGQGVFDGNVPVKPDRTNAEIKAARIEAAAKARKRKNKK